MASLNPAASIFIPASFNTPQISHGTPLTASHTPVVSSGSAFFPSSALTPASQQVLANELEALKRRQERHASFLNRHQQQQRGNGMSLMEQRPNNMSEPQSFEEMYGYQQLQTQCQAQYQMQYQQLYEQSWIPSHYPIPAQQRQTYQDVRGPFNQSFVGNHLETRWLNQNQDSNKHPPQPYAPPEQGAQSSRQLPNRGIETFSDPPPSQLFQDTLVAQAPQMTRKQLRQMEEAISTNHIGMQTMQACKSEDVVLARHSDNTDEKMIMAQYTAPMGLEPLYVSRVPWQYDQHQQPAYAQTQVYSQDVVHHGVKSHQRQQPYEHQSGRERAFFCQLPLYVHEEELELVPGYEGYSIYPERKVVRPHLVSAQVEESPVQNWPRTRLPRAKSSPATFRSHKGRVLRFNSDLTPTRRHTDDGGNNGNRMEENSLANEVQQCRQRQHTTIRNDENTNNGRYCQFKGDIHSSNGNNINESREKEGTDEEKRYVGAKRKERRKSTLDRELYSLHSISSERQESSASHIPATVISAAPTSSADNLH